MYNLITDGSAVAQVKGRRAAGNQGYAPSGAFLDKTTSPTLSFG